MQAGDSSTLRREDAASETDDWNRGIIAEFRANEGRVGGMFEGAPIALLHHQGRRSGREYVSPTMYLADERDAAAMYVFASKGGAPTHPDWYYNLTSAGSRRWRWEPRPTK